MKVSGVNQLLVWFFFFGIQEIEVSQREVNNISVEML